MEMLDDDNRICHAQIVIDERDADRRIEMASRYVDDEAG